MVAAHAGDLDSAKALGLRTAYVHRPLEYGPGKPSTRAGAGTLRLHHQRLQGTGDAAGSLSTTDEGHENQARSDFRRSVSDGCGERSVSPSTRSTVASSSDQSHLTRYSHVGFQ